MFLLLCLPWPIGSMYGTYANIWGILMVNVAIYCIHGSYGWCICVLTCGGSINGDSPVHQDTPVHHPNFNGIFLYKPSILGLPPFMEPPCVNQQNRWTSMIHLGWGLWPVPTSPLITGAVRWPTSAWNALEAFARPGGAGRFPSSQNQEASEFIINPLEWWWMEFGVALP